jgi:hypothetical protein
MFTLKTKPAGALPPGLSVSVRDGSWLDGVSRGQEQSTAGLDTPKHRLHAGPIESQKQPLDETARRVSCGNRGEGQQMCGESGSRSLLGSGC